MNKIAINISSLLSLSSNVKEKAKNYNPNLIRYRRNRWVYKVGDYLVRIKILKIPFSIKRTLTPIEFNKKTKVKDRDILVSCTCRFWKWNGPDFNAHNGDYSERTFSNLSSPDIRDPNRENYLCKHSYAALRRFKRDVKIAE